MIYSNQKQVINKLLTKIFFSIIFLTTFSSLTYAADLDITCHENVKPTITRNTDPLFQLSGFLPGDSASRTVYVKNDDPNNDCRIYFDITGTTNPLTDKIVVDIPTLFYDTLSKYISGDRMLMAELKSNQEITRTITLLFPSDADNTYSSKSTSFDITIISEWGPDTTPEEGDVAGTTDTKTTDTKTTATTEDKEESLTSSFPESLGVGGVDFETGEAKEEDLDTKEEVKTEEVKGEAEECTDKTLWWIPLLVQLALTFILLTIEKGALNKKHNKLAISLALGVASFLVIREIGCGCNPVWLCTNHWLINIFISLLPLLLYIKRRTESDSINTQQTL